ncbi:hypothetical protein K440DRAFT_610143 [Wilcoxina mikolae CBS 423.85]|nr:hypothetical protein K440DRAFT_610143 [Wilcoxina mikolae CBS 423.85]
MTLVSRTNVKFLESGEALGTELSSYSCHAATSCSENFPEVHFGHKGFRLAARDQIRLAEARSLILAFHVSQHRKES